MNTLIIKAKITDFVKKDKLQNALNELEEYFSKGSEEEHLNEVNALYGRLSAYRTKERQGVVEDKDKLELNKIRFAIIGLKDEVVVNDSAFEAKSTISEVGGVIKEGIESRQNLTIKPRKPKLKGESTNNKEKDIIDNYPNNNKEASLNLNVTDQIKSEVTQDIHFKKEWEDFPEDLNMEYLEPIFYENFSVRTNKELVGIWGDKIVVNDSSNSSGFTRIDNNQLVICNKLADKGYFIKMKTAINESIAYYLETKASLKTGDEDTYYGIIWGQLDVDNFYFFAINEKKKEVIIRFYQDGIKYHILRSKIINKLKVVNNFKILKQRHNIYFLLNNEIIKISKVFPFFGEGIGFVVFNEGEALFENILIKN